MITKQTVVDILMYLFENYIGEEVEVEPERDSVESQLEHMGFPQNEIVKAFDWLQDLAEIQEDESFASTDSPAFRIYSDMEKELLDGECIGFLMHLEQVNVLTPTTRELLLDRITALNNELDIEQLKWIVMIVLYSHPGEENAYTWMENLIYDQTVDYMQ